MPTITEPTRTKPRWSVTCPTRFSVSSPANRDTGRPPPIEDEAAEWKHVYDEFVRLKKECGEPTDGLSFEKFKNTLRKNRDQLLQRHGCKSVKFSVYIKDGKAALKANPCARSFA